MNKETMIKKIGEINSETIRQKMEELIGLKMPDEDWDYFQSKLEYKEFPKKQIILAAGQTEHYLSFLDRGIIRFFIPKEVGDQTIFLAFAGWFTSVYDSFISQSPSFYSSETLQASSLFRISYQNLQQVYQNTSVGNLIGRKASEALFILKTKREIELLSLNAEERYLKLLKEQPQVLKQIPQKYLASYIGITPQALSRIRKRIR